MSRNRSSKRFQRRHLSDALGLETVINPHKRQQYRKGYFMQEIPMFVSQDGERRYTKNAARKICGVWKHLNPEYKYVGSKFILHEK